MSEAPEKWLKQVESLILASQEIPMWGAIPPFPWDEFSSSFCAALKTEKVEISSKGAEWKSGDVILSGMGNSPLQLSVELSPLQGSLSLLFPAEDFSKLSSWIIDPKAGAEGFSDPYLQKGFFRYLLLEAIATVNKLHFLQGLSPKLIEMPLSKEDAYCIDISIQKGEEMIWGRVICPTIFQRAFKEYFAKDWHLSIPSHLYQKIEVPLGLTLGKTTLKQETLKALKEGDFVLLDDYSYSPISNKGTFQLVFDHTPLFQVRYKEEHVKILDYAVYYEASTMSEQHFPESPSEEEVEAFQTEMEGEEEPSPPSHPPPSEEIISPKEVPISLNVEVATLKISLEKLLTLKPGNILELGVRPEKGVNLVANGKCVARGDLIQIGEVLGVKITKI